MPKFQEEIRDAMSKLHEGQALHAQKLDLLLSRLPCEAHDRRLASLEHTRSRAIGAAKVAGLVGTAGAVVVWTKLKTWLGLH